MTSRTPHAGSTGPLDANASVRLKICRCLRGSALYRSGPFPSEPDGISSLSLRQTSLADDLCAARAQLDHVTPGKISAVAASLSDCHPLLHAQSPSGCCTGRKRINHNCWSFDVIAPVELPRTFCLVSCEWGADVVCAAVGFVVVSPVLRKVAAQSMDGLHCRASCLPRRTRSQIFSNDVLGGLTAVSTQPGARQCERGLGRECSSSSKLTCGAAAAERCCASWHSSMSKTRLSR